MGNIDLSKMGFSGKMGHIVAYVVNGKQRFRTFSEPRNPKTPKQTAHRSRFGFVSSKMSPLFKQIKIGHKDNNLNFGTVCGRVNREAVVGQSPNLSLDYSKIKIAEGKLQKPTYANVKVDGKTNIANVKWNTEIDPNSKYGSENDNVSIVCFNETVPLEIFRYNKIKRNSGSATIELPKHWNASETHFWLYVSSWDMRLNSDSVYIVYTKT